MPEQIGVEVVAVGVAAFSRALRTAQDDLERFQGAINNSANAATTLGTNLLTIGGNMERLGRSMTIGITAPLGILTGSLISAGVAFEDSFAGITKTVDGLGVGFDEIKAAAQDKLGIVVTNMDEARDAADKLGMSFGDLTPVGESVRKQFREMALEIPLSANELNKFGETAGQFGVQADQIDGVTRSMAALEVATNLAGDAAGSQLIQLKNITKSSLDASEFVNRAGSALVYLGNSSVSTESQILDMTMRLAAAGDLAKFTEPEMFAWGTTISDMGVRAEKGGTAVSRMINEMMIAIATGSDNVETFAGVMGVSVDELKQMFEKDASSAIFAFTQSLTQGIEAGTVTKGMLTDLGLGGVRAIDVVERLSGAQDQFTNNLNMANKSWDEGIALQEEAEKRYNTVKSQIQLTKNAFADLGITIFDLIKDDIKKLLDNIREGIAWFKNLDKGILRTILKFVGIAAAIGPVLVVLGALISTVGTILTAIGGFPAALKLVGKTLLGTLGPVGLLISALMLLIPLISGAGIKFNVDFSSVLTDAQKTFDTIKTEIGKIGDAFANLKIGDTGLLESLQGLLDTLIQGIVDKILFVMKFVQDMAKGFSDAFIPFITDKGPQIERILGNFKTIIDNVREAFEKVGTAIATALGLDTSGTGVGEFLGMLAGLAFEGLLDSLEAASGFVADLAGSFAKIAESQTVKDIITGVAGAVNSIKVTAAQVMLDIAEALSQMKSAASGVAGNWFTNISEGLQGIIDTVSSSDTLQSLIGLLKTMSTISLKNFEGAIANIKQAFGGFIEGITPFLNAQGPRFKRIMEDLGKAGAALSPLAKALGKLFKALDKLGGTVIRNLEKLLVSLGIIEEGQAAGSVGKFLGMWAGVMIDEALKGIETIISLLDNMINAITWVVDAGANFATWLEGLSGPSERAGQSIGEFIGKFEGLLNGGLEEKIKTGVQNILTSISTFAQGILTGILTNIDQAFIDLLGEARWNKLQETLFIKIPAIISAVGIKVGEKFSEIRTTVEGKLQEVLISVMTKWNEIKAVIEGVLDPIKNAVSNAWEALKNSIGIKTGEVKTDVDNKWNEIKAKIDEKLDPIKNAVSNAWDTLKQNTNEKLTQLQTDLSTIWNNIKTGVKEAFDGMVKEVQTTIQGWVDNFIKEVDRLYQRIVGGSIIPDLVNGVLWWFRFLRDTAASIVSGWSSRITTIVNDVKLAFESFGTAVGTVVGNVKGSLDGLVDKMSGVLADITGSPQLKIQHPFEGFESYMQNAQFFSTVTNQANASMKQLEITIVSGAQTMQRALDSLAASIQQTFNGLWAFLNTSSKLTTFQNNLTAVWSGLTIGANAAFNSLKSVVASAMQSIANSVGGLSNSFGGIPDRISQINNSFNSVMNKINEVKWAFDQLNWKVANTVNEMVWNLQRVVNEMNRVQAGITGSPELIIQHPFEGFEKYLKATDFSKLIEGSMALNSMNQISMVAPAGTGNQSSTTIDRRIQANISGVPLDTANGIVDILQRQTRMSEVFQQ